MVTIDGRIFSQGVVPDERDLRAALSDGPSPEPAQPPQPRGQPLAPGVNGDLPLMTVYTSDHCPGCELTLELAEESRHAGGVEVEVINLDQLDLDVDAVPPEIVATPTVLVDGRLVSMGTPDREQLRRAIVEATQRRAEAE